MNYYLPRKARIEAVTQETHSAGLDIKTYRLHIQDGQPFTFLPGQFAELSLPGAGEAPFGFSSLAAEDGSFEITIKRTGSLTDVLHALDEGGEVWLRGPFGNHFPLETLENAPLLFVAGGLGLAPLRPALQHVLQNRPQYGALQLLLAARTPEDHVFAYDFDAWAAAPGTTLTLTIDAPAPGWQGEVGFPHQLLENFQPAPGTKALVCGPPMMIKAVCGALQAQGLPETDIYTTLEMRMSCGAGKCGRCNIGRQYVCVDGPVFRLDELAALPEEY